MPLVPCLEGGSRKRPIALPLELCTIAPGQRRLQLTPDQTAAMIRTAAARPHQRAEFITRIMQRTTGFESDPHLREFGVRVDPRMIKVGTRHVGMRLRLPSFISVFC